MIAPILSHSEEQMKKTLEKMKTDFSALRTGRAGTAILENIRVEHYGSTMPLNQLATISAPEPRTLEIRPWDKGALQSIERAIHQSNLGLTPNNDGAIIRLVLPTLTEERRKDLIKAIRKSQFQIGNNRGGINGWIAFAGVYGKLISIER